MTEFIKLPIFEESRMIEDFQMLMAAATKHYANATHYSSSLGDELTRRLGVWGVGDPLDASIDELKYANKASKSLLRRTMHRLAANKFQLRRGRAVPARPMYLNPEWAIANVRDVQPLSKADSSGNGMGITWLVYTGPLAGERYVQHINHESGAEIYRICAGRPHNCKYETPKQLFQMRAALMLGWEEGKITFDGMAINRPSRKRNIELARKRSRAFNKCFFKVPVDCAECAVGLNECEWSLNKRDTSLVLRPYPNFEYVAHNDETTPEVDAILASRARYG